MSAAYRICKTKRVATAFDGEGSRRAGGRWNSKGTTLVYVGSVGALSLLEMIVHTDADGAALSWSIIRIDFDDVIVQQLAAPLKADWRGDITYTRVIGNAWVTAASGAILQVPSAIIHTEHNYLVNPAHADFKRIVISPAEALPIDPRLRLATP